MMMILLMLLGGWGCSTQPLVLDARINAHWIEKDEPAPFSGIILNDFTYIKMREKIDQCQP